MIWQLADAKNRFSEVVRRALSDGPQKITRRDRAVIVIDEDDYLRLTGARPSLSQYLIEGPSLDAVDLARDRSPMRDIPL